MSPELPRCKGFWEMPLQTLEGGWTMAAEGQLHMSTSMLSCSLGQSNKTILNQ